MIQEQPEHREEYRRGGIVHDPETYEHGYRESETREPVRQKRRPYAEGDYDESRRHREHEEYDYDEAPPEVKTVFSTSGINIVAGLWLILAPFALGYSAVEAAVWNSIVLGVAVGLMAVVRVMRPEEYEGVSWVNFVLGVWLLVSPFVLGLANIEALVWNNIIVGIIVIALAATSALATRRLHDPTAGSTPPRKHRAGRRSSRV